MKTAGCSVDGFVSFSNKHADLLTSRVDIEISALCCFFQSLSGIYKYGCQRNISGPHYHV